jgi:hypothetical protein
MGNTEWGMKQGNSNTPQSPFKHSPFALLHFFHSQQT